MFNLGNKSELSHLWIEVVVDIEQVVKTHYVTLYRLALALTRREAEAWDLTQQTFLFLSSKQDQVRDAAKVKAWLITTMRREFYRQRRREKRSSEHEHIAAAEQDLLVTAPEAIDQLAADEVMQALLEVDERYRLPLIMFYLEEFSYKEIAAALEIPVGTVMSRLARGKTQLAQLLAPRPEDHNIRPLDASAEAKLSNL